MKISRAALIAIGVLVVLGIVVLIFALTTGPSTMSTASTSSQSTVIPLMNEWHSYSQNNVLQQMGKISFSILNSASSQPLDILGPFFGLNRLAPTGGGSVQETLAAGQPASKKNAPQTLPPPMGSKASCPVGTIASRDGDVPKCNNAKANVHLISDTCPSRFTSMPQQCQRTPSKWSLALGENAFASPQSFNDASVADLNEEFLVVKQTFLSANLTGGELELVLRNTGNLDAHLLSLVIQLVETPNVQACLACTEDEDDNGNVKQSTTCSEQQGAVVVAAVGSEHIINSLCPSGHYTPAHTCGPASAKNNQPKCIYSVDYNNSIPILDLSGPQPLPLELHTHVIAKKTTDCDDATTLRLRYALPVSVMQYQAMALSGQRYKIRLLLTYDAGCGTGNTCGFDYNCDGTVNAIRTLRLESSCFMFNTAMCTDACEAASLHQAGHYVFSPPVSPASSSYDSSVLTTNTTVIFSVGAAGDHVFVAPTCSAIRTVTNSNTSVAVSNDATFETMLTVASPDCLEDPTPLEQVVNVTCPPLDIDCEVSSWSQFRNDCDTRCTFEEPSDTCNCQDGTATFRRVIETPASGNGTPCPTDLQKRDDCGASWSEWSSCTCPGPTQYRVFKTSVYLAYPERCAIKEIRPCNTTTCDVDCVVSAWSEWSSTCQPSPSTIEMGTCTGGICTDDCYFGIKNRTRTIVTEPEGEGQVCPALIDISSCQSKIVSLEEECLTCLSCPAEPSNATGILGCFHISLYPAGCPVTTKKVFPSNATCSCDT